MNRFKVISQITLDRDLLSIQMNNKHLIEFRHLRLFIRIWITVIIGSHKFQNHHL